MIIKKVILLDAPVPPLAEGSEFVISVPDDSLTWGVYSLTTFAQETTVVSWGDGTETTYDAANASATISQPSHTYAKGGTYRVRITDTIRGLSPSYRSDNTVSTVYAPMIRSFRTVSARISTLAIAGFRNCHKMAVCDIRSVAVAKISANMFESCSSLATLDNLPRAMTTFTNRAFWGCAGLAGRVNLPTVEDITASAAEYAPFLGCPNITELHFSAASEATLKARELYAIAFGAENATVVFDL